MPSEPQARVDLAVIMAEIGDGGMGKMRLRLINAIAARGHRVRLLLGDERGSHALELDPSVAIVALRTTHATFGVPRLASYLRRNRPRAVLTLRLRVTMLAHRARALARVPTRIVSTGNTHSTALDDLDTGERHKRLRRIRRYVGSNDAIIAISNGIAADQSALVGWPRDRITVAPNPVVAPELDRLAREPVAHPWFQPGEPPVILGIGRFVSQKDFATLIAAFARVRRRRNARLVILGEGPQRESLRAISREHDVADAVDLPGFSTNVYAYLARSRLFVLSSRYEGLGNVLIEALAVGTPVVATDCPSGPAEILEHGRLGPLVPVGDAAALADAMARVWDQPPDPESLKSSVRERFSVERSAAIYVSALGLEE